ncbi:MAG: hypothetical protein ACD_79C00727G0004 [uncultured bacterium]|nr:MAG: hypothetical protein ACD_79C00727G0004 [uncultured bacterium]
MKKITFTVMVICLLSFFADIVFSAEREDVNNPRGWYKKSAEGLEFWFKTGYLDSELNVRESLLDVAMQETEYSVDGLYGVGMGTRYQFLDSAWPRLSLFLEAYTARTLQGDQTYDYYNFNTPSVHTTTTADVDSEVDQYDFNIGWNLIVDGNSYLDLLFGYYYVSNYFEVDNQTTLLINGARSNDITLVHVETYDSTLKGNYLGLSGKLSLLNDKLKLNGSIKYIPDLRGEADQSLYINDLLVKHEGNGDGFVYEGGISFKPRDNWNYGLIITASDLKIDDGHELVVDNYDLSSDTYLFSNDLDHIQLNSLKTELRIGYDF